MVAWRGFRLGEIATVTRLAVRPCENNVERSSWIDAVELGGFDQRIMCASDSGDLSPPPDARISIKTEPASSARPYAYTFTNSPPISIFPTPPRLSTEHWGRDVSAKYFPRQRELLCRPLHPSGSRVRHAGRTIDRKMARP